MMSVKVDSMDVVECPSADGSRSTDQSGWDHVVVNGSERRHVPSWLTIGGEENCSDSKAELNFLVMNYLLMEGHKEAADVFAQESKTAPNIGHSGMEERIRIRQAVCSGRIADAIVFANDLDPAILEQNPEVYFGLRKQQLVEIIRSGDRKGAVEFARSQLAAIGEENEKFLPLLEETMALLLYDKPQSSPYSHLLSRAHIEALSSELNSAILQHFGLPTFSGLQRLLQAIGWSQEIMSQANLTHWDMETLGEMKFTELGRRKLTSR